MLHNDQDKTQADLTDSNAQDAETKAPAGLDGKSLDAIFGVKLDVPCRSGAQPYAHFGAAEPDQRVGDRA